VLVMHIYQNPNKPMHAIEAVTRPLDHSSSLPDLKQYDDVGVGDHHQAAPPYLRPL